MLKRLSLRVWKLKTPSSGMPEDPLRLSRSLWSRMKGNSEAWLQTANPKALPRLGSMINITYKIVRSN